MKKTIVIGGGPAGMMAAYSSAKSGNPTVLIEKNSKLGKKLYITGKGRCNLTNDTDLNGFMENVVVNPKFLYGSLSALLPSDLMDLFESYGLSLKVERGKRVFPLSDKASDVTKTLEKMMKSVGVEVLLDRSVLSIDVQDGRVVGVQTEDGKFDCDKVIVCTGGVSYSATGSTGDGYKFASKVGHNIVPPKPSLVGIELADSFYSTVQGLSLKNVTLTAKFNNKTVFSEFGEALFTHFGISGPIALSCSSVINKYDCKQIELSLDFKPALTKEVLDLRIQREFKDENRKTLFSVMRSLLPKNMVEVFLKKASLNGNKNCSQITLQERERIVNLFKDFKMRVKGLRPIDEAIVTSGGVNVKEVNPKTMESKIVGGLYFAGEVLDVDAYTGGFNVQIAFSTGYLAGIN
ncbi:MAG: NAD(P)/FAD-dependent oxidoreductase [Clostridiales bacterium]|nr:NAD(P)/FAD-dependent oxidoreductase [Clostridiales bacterium]